LNGYSTLRCETLELPPYTIDGIVGEELCAAYSSQSFAHVRYRIYEPASESPGGVAGQATHNLDYPINLI